MARSFETIIFGCSAGFLGMYKKIFFSRQDAKNAKEVGRACRIAISEPDLLLWESVFICDVPLFLPDEGFIGRAVFINEFLRVLGVLARASLNAYPGK